MILIVRSVNETPEEEVNERLTKLRKQGMQFKIVSANTSVHTVGEMNLDSPSCKMLGVARHVYYVTTVVLEVEYR